MNQELENLLTEIYHPQRDSGKCSLKQVYTSPYNYNVLTHEYDDMYTIRTIRNDVKVPIGQVVQFLPKHINPDALVGTLHLSSTFSSKLFQFEEFWTTKDAAGNTLLHSLARHPIHHVVRGEASFPQLSLVPKQFLTLENLTIRNTVKITPMHYLLDCERRAINESLTLLLSLGLDMPIEFKDLMDEAWWDAFQEAKKAQTPEVIIKTIKHSDEVVELDF